VNVADPTSGGSPTSGTQSLTVDSDLTVAVTVNAVGYDFDPLDARYAPSVATIATADVAAKVIADGTAIDLFTVQTGWSNGANRSDYTATDSTHGSSMLISSTTGQTQFNVTFPSPLDLSDSVLSIWVKPIDSTYIDSMYFDFATGGVTFNTDAGPAFFVDGVKQASGEWRQIVVPLGAYTTVPTPTDVRRIRISLVQTGASPAQMAIADVRIHTMSQPSGIVWTFDDGKSSVYSIAMPIMRAAGFVGVVCVETDNVGTAGYMTRQQLRELRSLGWEMVNHTDTGGTMAAYTSDQVETAVSDGYVYLNCNGFTTGAQHLVLPGGVTNATIRRKCERMTTRTYLSTGGTPIAAQVGDQTMVPRYYINSTISSATVASKLDGITARPGIYIFEFHDFVVSGATGTQVTTAEFTAMVAAATSRALPAYTLTDIYGQ
jgi:hypothetical protein